MSYSLNEVEATTKKAARGAGFEWGLAEEAGRAARWLCANGLGGCGKLAEYLAGNRCFPPDDLEGSWRSNQGDLCPLQTGAALSDLALEIAKKPVSISNVAVPAILLPFAAWAALATELNMTLKIDGITATTDGVTLCLSGEIPARAVSVVVSSGGTIFAAVPRFERAEPRAESWRVLSEFAHKTYAPATEESRLLGAGAGLSDND